MYDEDVIDYDPDSLPTRTLGSVLDQLIWSECRECRYIRFGIAIGAIVSPIASALIIIALI